MVAFHRDRSGNVAILFGFMFLPLVMLVGGAIDYASAVRLQRGTQRAADSAALAGAKAASSYLATHGRDAASVTAAGALAKAEASKVASANARSLNYKSQATVEATLTLQATAPIVKVSIIGAAPAHFGGLLNIGQANVGASSTATLTPSESTYTDIFLALDRSASMGLASTYASMQTMANSSANCQFVCHNVAGVDTLPLARSLGVEMRLDVSKRYAGELLDKLANNMSATGVNDLHRVSLYSFDFNVTSWPATSSMASVRTNVADMDLSASTSYVKLFKKIESDIGSGGTGRTNTDRKKYLVFVTDGIEDTIYDGWTWGETAELWRWGPTLGSYAGGGDVTTPLGKSRGTSALQVANCAALKTKGIQIMVIDLIAIPFTPTDKNYDIYLKNVGYIAGEISPALRNCASPGMYFPATTPEDIRAAFDKVFEGIVASPLRIAH